MDVREVSDATLLFTVFPVQNDHPPCSEFLDAEAVFRTFNFGVDLHSVFCDSVEISGRGTRGTKDVGGKRGLLAPFPLDSLDCATLL